MMMRVLILIMAIVSLALPATARVAKDSNCPTQRLVWSCPANPEAVGSLPKTQIEQPCACKVIVAEAGDSGAAETIPVSLRISREGVVMAGITTGGIDRPPKRSAA